MKIPRAPILIGFLYIGYPLAEYPRPKDRDSKIGWSGWKSDLSAGSRSPFQLLGLPDYSSPRMFLTNRGP